MNEESERFLPNEKGRKQKASKPTLWFTLTGMVTQKERRVDALALRADEGRDKLRKAAGRSTYPLIRRYPNGETRMESLHAS